MLKLFWKYFVNAKTAIGLIVVLAAILIFGTAYESNYGTPAVQMAIYKTWWFVGLLGLIFLNVLFAALSRIPWQKRHTGFLIVHLGLLTLLSGCILTVLFGVEGQLALEEGQRGDTIQSQQEVVHFFKNEAPQALAIKKVFSKKIKKHPWNGTLENESIGIKLDDYAKHSRVDILRFDDGEEDNPQALIVLSNPNVNQEFWMGKGDTASLGPLVAKFDQAKDKTEFDSFLKKEDTKAPKPREDLGNLVIGFSNNDSITSFPVKKLLKRAQKIPGTKLKVKVNRMLPHALVVDNKLKNESDKFFNPAVEFEITGPEGTETHVAFTLFPGFSTLHHKTSHDYKVQAQYKVDNLEEPEATNALLLMAGPKNQIAYTLKSRTGIKKGILQKNEVVQTDWMGLQLQLKEFYPKARMEKVLRPIRDVTDIPNPAPTLHAVITDSEGSSLKDLWIRKNSEQKINIQDDIYWIRYMDKQIPLGFSVELTDFVLQKYPGSQSPMSYESYVSVIDPEKGEPFDFHIYMNHPLLHRGYKFFQSSYVEEPGRPAISIFAVNKDPGIPFVYGGSIILVAGIAILFFGLKKKNKKKKKK
jgi:cytochrome c biogenesis protein ResB